MKKNLPVMFFEFSIYDIQKYYPKTDSFLMNGIVLLSVSPLHKNNKEYLLSIGFSDCSNPTFNSVEYDPIGNKNYFRLDCYELYTNEYMNEILSSNRFIIKYKVDKNQSNIIKTIDDFEDYLLWKKLLTK